MSITEILAAGNMSPAVAAMFWIGIERGASIIIAADPPSSGKTTTLSALLSFTPPDTVVYFTRGAGETFALPEPSPAYPTYLLINEMSDHIPVYTWDENARRSFHLMSNGYSLASTMHDNDVPGVIRQLEQDLQIPRSHIANLTFVAPMHIGHRDGAIRRMTEVAFLEPNGDDLSIAQLATWDEVDDVFTLFPDDNARRAYAEWAGLSDTELIAQVERREQFLLDLLDQGTTEIAEVNEAIEAFYLEANQPTGEG
jgi:type IV secretory pathway ATPase VirB11/archaellum biosynthesis ATPase